MECYYRAMRANTARSHWQDQHLSLARARHYSTWHGDVIAPTYSEHDDGQFEPDDHVGVCQALELWVAALHATMNFRPQLHQQGSTSPSPPRSATPLGRRSRTSRGWWAWRSNSGPRPQSRRGAPRWRHPLPTPQVEYRATSILLDCSGRDTGNDGHSVTMLKTQSCVNIVARLLTNVECTSISPVRGRRGPGQFDSMNHMYSMNCHEQHVQHESA